MGDGMEGGREDAGEEMGVGRQRRNAIQKQNLAPAVLFLCPEASHFTLCLRLLLHGSLTKAQGRSKANQNHRQGRTLVKLKGGSEKCKGARSNFLTETSQLGPTGATSPCVRACVQPVGAFSQIPTHTEDILEEVTETHPSPHNSYAVVSPQLTVPPEPRASPSQTRGMSEAFVTEAHYILLAISSFVSNFTLHIIICFHIILVFFTKG